MAAVVAKSTTPQRHPLSRPIIGHWRRGFSAHGLRLPNSAFARSVGFFCFLAVFSMWPASLTSQIPAAALGRDSALLPAANLVMVLPSISAGTHALQPLLSRLGLALPEFDPHFALRDLRVRFGLDVLDGNAVEKLGIDPTGPIAFVDSGSLTHPVLIMHLLPSGNELFEAGAVLRAVKLAKLQHSLRVETRGIETRGWAASEGDDAQFLYAFDRGRVALAPHGCAQGQACVAAALKPTRRLLANTQSRTLLTALGARAAFVYATQDALATAPYAQLRRLAQHNQVIVVGLDGSASSSTLQLRCLLTAKAQQDARTLKPLSGKAARLAWHAGATSLWLGLSADTAAPLAQAPSYLPALRTLLAEANIQLDNELAQIADGGLGLHFLELENQLPGLLDAHSIDVVSQGFFAEQVLNIPLRDSARAKALVQRTHQLLTKRGGQLHKLDIVGFDAWQYAEAGKVLSCAINDNELVVASGPGSLEQYLASRRAAAFAVGENRALRLRVDAPALHAALGAVSLLNSGDNRDVRTVWVIHQAIAPLLRRLGQLDVSVAPDGKYLNIYAEFELTGRIMR